MTAPPAMIKYPRTQHLEGSRLQPGDHDLDAMPFARVAGAPLVVEEKVDGANAALRFDEDGALWLQSRGHFLTGGAREKHFHLFKQWATAHAPALFAALGPKYVLYGEWLYAKHTIYYDLLPHYFVEYDLFDVEAREFLSTPRRRAILGELPLAPVRVLFEGRPKSMRELVSLVGRSGYKSASWRERLRETALREAIDVERAVRETDPSEEMEGLYVKHEEDGKVIGRYKYVRASFLTCVVDSGTHWLKRPIVPNALAPDVDLFAAV
jgi:hypothetical protein